MSQILTETVRKENVVYEIRCNLCNVNGMGESYVGESMRPVRLRYNEHRRDAVNRTPNTPFGDHFQNVHTHDEIASKRCLLTLKILYRAQDHPDRKIAESILIRSATPSLNTQGSSWPIMRIV